MDIYRFIYSNGCDEDLPFPNCSDAVKYGYEIHEKFGCSCIYVWKKLLEGNKYDFICKIGCSY